jgi:glycine/D-amino acid oxidase-like deaminating enzyme
MTEKQDKILIIGCGIAGATLAYTLLEEGFDTHIISDENGESSSKVAAGIFNPVTGKKLQKTWLAHELFPYFQQFYTAIEQRFGVNFMEYKSIVRPIESVKEQNSYFEQIEKNNLEQFGHFTHDTYPENIDLNPSLGNFTTKQSGWIKVPVYLETLKNYFKTLGVFTDEVFDHQAIQLAESGAAYKGIVYDKIIFAEGFSNRFNPYFRYLKFAYVKGELLDVEIPTIDFTNKILLKSAFLVPKGNKKYVLGATYHWDTLDFVPSEAAKEQLLQRFNKISTQNLIIENHRAGVRPATPDRRPIIGLHPKHEQLGIFNGLGSKGVSLAPYMAYLFKKYLTDRTELLPEININRFHALYLSSEI